MYFVKNLLFYSTHTVSRFAKMGPEKINFYHLVFLLKGKTTYYVNNVKYELEENDALLLPPGTLRERERNDHPSKYVIFNFLTYPDAEIDLDIHIKSAITPSIKKLLSLYPYSFSSCFTSTSTPSTGEKVKARQLMSNLLNCILIELMDYKRCKTRNPHVLNAIKYINTHITYPLSLNKVSEAIHLSKEYTAKIFKEETGKTVTEYINEQKMIIARDMLNSNEVSLRDTSLYLGYENYSYFSRIFKKHFYISPAKIKKNT